MCNSNIMFKLPLLQRRMGILLSAITYTLLISNVCEQESLRFMAFASGHFKGFTYLKFFWCVFAVRECRGLNYIKISTY
jgi:hypothetical protein